MFQSRGKSGFCVNVFIFVFNIFVVGEVSEQIRNRMKVLCFHLNLILVKSFLYDKPW